MKYEIVRMPQGREDLSAVLEELAPFLDAMYSQSDIERFGEINFLLDYWLFLWDTGTGFFLTKRDDDGKLLMVAVLTKYRDIWHGRDKLEIHRTALVNGDTVDEEQEINGLIEYLTSVSSILGFDFLYYNTRDDNGNEYKKLMWGR